MLINRHFSTESKINTVLNSVAPGESAFVSVHEVQQFVVFMTQCSIVWTHRSGALRSAFFSERSPSNGGGKADSLHCRFSQLYSISPGQRRPPFLGQAKQPLPRVKITIWCTSAPNSLRDLYSIYNLQM